MKHFLLSILVFVGLFSYGQMPGWQHKQIYEVSDANNRTAYPILLKINTDSLINIGQLNADASDIRFSTDCGGTNLLDYFIEGAADSTSTSVWVKMDLVADSSHILYMIHGNDTASGMSNFDLVFPNAYIPTEDVTIDVEELNYDWIEIKEGINVTLIPIHAGVLTCRARNIIIDGTINGDFLGYDGGAVDDGEGPGKGYGMDVLGAAGYGGGTGAGHGGIGGIGDFQVNEPTDPVGQAYDDNTQVSIDAGSGGGAGGYLAPYSVGGNGGAGFAFIGTKITLNGSISADGQTPITYSFYGAGGGSGGGVMLQADYINYQGEISVQGGDGGLPDPAIQFGYESGGGAGGRIKFFHSKEFVNAGTSNAEGGSSYGLGQEPEDGAVFDSLLVSSEPSIVKQNLPTAITLASVTGDMTICLGDSIQVYGTSGFAMYDYYINNVLQLSTPNDTVFLSDFAHGDTLTVVGNVFGCTYESNFLIIQFYDTIQSVFEHTSNLYDASFTNLSVNGDTYLWDFGDGVTSTSENPTHTYTLTGLYTVCLEVSNSVTGCLENISCEDVLITCPYPKTGYIYTGEDWTYSFTDTFAVGITTWKVDGELMQQGYQFDYTFPGNGSYEVCQIISNICGVDSLCQTIQVVCNIPTAGFNFEIMGNEVLFQDFSTGATNWTWHFGDGDTLSSQNVTHVYPDSTAGYEVCLYVTNSCGERDSICDSLYIESSTTGILNVQGEFQIELYPNPVLNNLHIRANTSEEIMLRIIDGFGTEVINKMVKTGDKISLTHLSSGYYYYQLKTASGIRQGGKLFKTE